MATTDTDLDTPIHAFYVRADEHTEETIRDTLLELHLDELWLRITPLPAVRFGESTALQLELYHLREGLPVLPEVLAVALSRKDHTALRLSVDGTHTSVGYELFHNGQPGPVWAGDIETFESDERTPKSARPAAELAACRAEFLARFAKRAALDFEAVVGSGTINACNAEEAVAGTLVLSRGRLLRTVPGMGRWPELFRFHDRNLASDDDDAAAGRDHVALLGVDLKILERLWRRTPASHVYQLLRVIEPLKAAVLGPLAGLLPQALATIEALPPEQPLTTGAEGDLGLYELLAAATGTIYMVGDRVRYLDERFFPMLSLADTPLSTAALADSLEDVAQHGVITAMTEVLPYAVPEGQMLEAFADEEIAPLAAWAVTDESYEGSLFLLDPTRLRQLIEDFDIEAFHGRIAAFRQAWYALADPTGGSLEEWLVARKERDDEELNRWEDTFVELQHTVRLADLNGLALALLFYSE